ncbi:MAG: hypothetical protein HC901_00105 [Bdellovibrionaceae bacterium]|nr:hypothetical protein [Pseudobdellovibrionaceae bacterium]
MRIPILFACFMAFTMLCPGLFAQDGATKAIRYDQHSGPHTFGAKAIHRALAGASDANDYEILTQLVEAGSGDIHKEGFAIRKTGKQIVISGIDQTGIMYGMLELAEQIDMRGSLQEVQEGSQNPRFPFRAIKFNLPWSSYRRFEGLQANMEAARDLEMWRAFLDMMAENRFNTLTLWNLHPWPYLVRTKNFPDANPLSDEELADWKQFWTGLFQMAKDRGIDTYLLNWNIL